MAIQVFFGCNEAVVLRYSGLGFEDVGMGCSGVLFCIVVASFMYENAIQVCGLLDFCTYINPKFLNPHTPCEISSNLKRTNLRTTPPLHQITPFCHKGSTSPFLLTLLATIKTTFRRLPYIKVRGGLEGVLLSGMGRCSSPHPPPLESTLKDHHTRQRWKKPAQDRQVTVSLKITKTLELWY